MTGPAGPPSPRRGRRSAGPYPVAYARYRQAGAILRDRGERVDARAALGTARAIAIRLAARPLLDEIDRLARLARLDLVAE